MSNGQKTGQWGANYYKATRTGSFDMHSDYGGRSINDMQINNTDYGTVYFVHDSPNRVYVYCTVDNLISDTASTAFCRMRIKDNQYHRGSVGHTDNNTWGNGIDNFNGGRIDIRLEDNTNAIHPTGLVYLDADANGTVDASEMGLDQEPFRGQARTVNFEPIVRFTGLEFRPKMRVMSKLILLMEFTMVISGILTWEDLLIPISHSMDQLHRLSTLMGETIQPKPSFFLPLQL